MSSIPTRHIDGDVAVGRNVTAGGEANIQGDVRVGHDLRVEGWLDALHIKTACKGVFSSYDKLEHAYPSPQPGWFAGVCTGEKTELWLAVREPDEYRGATWKRSSGAFMAEVDDTRYKEMLKELAALRDKVNSMGSDTAALNAIKEDISRNKKDIENLGKELTTAQNTAGAAKTDAKAASDTANKALPPTIGIDELDTMGVADVRAMKELVRANALHTRYTVCSNGLIVGTLDIFSDFSRCELTQVLESHHPIENRELQTDTHTDGKIYRYFRLFNFDAPENGGLSAAKETWTKWEEVIPHGAARLDENGKVPEENLPDLSFVVEFGGMVSGVEAPNASSLHLSTDDGCTVKYDTANKRFLLWVLPTGGGLVTPPGGVNFGTYYPNWLDAKEFGKNENGYWRPQTGKLYICTSENRQYRWDGETLAKCGPDGIELGKEAGMAFPGDEGAQMQEDVQNLKRDAFDMSNLVNNMGIFPFDGWWDGKQPEPTWGVWYGPSKSYEGEFMFWSFGGTNFYGKAPEEYNSDDVGYDGNIYRKGNELYRIVDGKLMTFGAQNAESISSLSKNVNSMLERLTKLEEGGSGGAAQPVKVIKFDEDTGTLYI